MGRLNDLSITVRPVITIDDDTANTILNLLELYCRATGQKIDTYYITEEERKIAFQFLKDQEDATEGNESELGFIVGKGGC